MVGEIRDSEKNWQELFASSGFRLLKTGPTLMVIGTIPHKLDWPTFLPFGGAGLNWD